jgi:hypothetical protein
VRDPGGRLIPINRDHINHQVSRSIGAQASVAVPRCVLPCAQPSEPGREPRRRAPRSRSYAPPDQRRAGDRCAPSPS